VSLSVVFTAEAEDQLLELHRYIAAAGSTEVAARYAESILAFCEDLGAFAQISPLFTEVTEVRVSSYCLHFSENAVLGTLFRAV
jgi:plasmid stabilization system protein ParE